jgi:hypothetical protein
LPHRLLTTANAPVIFEVPLPFVDLDLDSASFAAEDHTPAIGLLEEVGVLEIEQELGGLVEGFHRHILPESLSRAYEWDGLSRDFSFKCRMVDPT